MNEKLANLKYDNTDAQKKIDEAKQVIAISFESLSNAKVKLEAGVYEIEKKNFQNAISFFESINQNTISIEKDVSWITKAIEESEKIENNHQANKQNKEASKAKSCFLFWCS